MKLALTPLVGENLARNKKYVVSSIVVMLLPILMLYQFVDGTQIVLANALRGLSDVKPIMWISFITNFLIAIPAGYILVFSVTLLGLRARKTMNP